MSYDAMKAYAECSSMLTVYQAEQGQGRIKFSDELDCLPANAMRVEKRVFVDMDHLKATVASLEDRGFTVCVDLGEYFYETAT